MSTELTNYLHHSKIPPKTQPGTCCLCHKTTNCRHGLLVPYPIEDKQNYGYCDECNKAISDYDSDALVSYG